MTQANLRNAANAGAHQRVFKKNSQWYFRTRDANTRGPFIDKQQAFWALAKHIRQQALYR